MGWNGFNNNFFSKETGGISQYDLMFHSILKIGSI